MPIKYTVVFIAFLVTFLISRIVSTSATKKLDSDTRHRIVDEFTPRSNSKLIAVVSFCAAYLLAITFVPGSSGVFTAIFFLAFLLYMVFSMVRTTSRLRSIRAPNNYIRLIGLSWGIFIIGVGIIATAVVLF